MSYLFLFIVVLIIPLVRADINGTVHVNDELEVDTDYETNYNNNNETKTYKKDNDSISLGSGFPHENPYKSNLTANGTIQLENEFDDESFSLRSDFSHVSHGNQNKSYLESNGTKPGNEFSNDSISLRSDFSGILNLNESNLESNRTNTPKNNGSNDSAGMDMVMNLVTGLQNDLDQKFLLFKEKLKNIFKKNEDSSTEGKTGKILKLKSN